MVRAASYLFDELAFEFVHRFKNFRFKIRTLDGSVKIHRQIDRQRDRYIDRSQGKEKVLTGAA